MDAKLSKEKIINQCEIKSGSKKRTIKENEKRKIKEKKDELNENFADKIPKGNLQV